LQNVSKEVLDLLKSTFYVSSEQLQYKKIKNYLLYLLCENIN